VGTSRKQARIETELSAFRAEQTVEEDAPTSVRVATEHIHDHLFDPELTVKRLRNRLGLTDAMFSSRFRLHHGQTPARYIRYLRVEAAKRLLRRFDSLCIADVAFHVGYEHYRTFARVFKRVTEQSPQAFRENAESS
jgi:AraC-like DNA-binding protein